MALEPITRAEQIMSGESLEPITREEMFLAKAAGMDVDTPEPITRREMFLSKISGGSGGGSGGSESGEMTGVGADIYVVYGGQLFTFAEFFATMQGEPSLALALEGRTIILVRDELPKCKLDHDYIYLLGVTKSDGAVYLNQGEWVPFTDALGIPCHGWIDKAALEGLDLTDEANAGFYAVQKVSYPFVDGSLTDLVSYSKSIQFIQGHFALATANLPNATSIGYTAFFERESLESVNMPKVEYIGRDAFNGCTNLTSIALPASVKRIDAVAFENCTSLASITFGGTVAQWNAITFGGRWNSGVPATEVLCSDGVVSLV